jgi:hypothetical protein
MIGPSPKIAAAAFEPAIPLDRVSALSSAVARGELSLPDAIEGFVRLVVEARAPFVVTPDFPARLAASIAKDEPLAAQFEALFAQLQT